MNVMHGSQIVGLTLIRSMQQGNYIRPYENKRLEWCILHWKLKKNFRSGSKSWNYWNVSHKNNSIHKCCSVSYLIIIDLIKIYIDVWFEYELHCISLKISGESQVMERSVQLMNLSNFFKIGVFVSICQSNGATPFTIQCIHYTLGRAFRIYGYNTPTD